MAKVYTRIEASRGLGWGGGVSRGFKIGRPGPRDRSGLVRGPGMGIGSGSGSRLGLAGSQARVVACDRGWGWCRLATSCPTNLTVECYKMPQLLY